MRSVVVDASAALAWLLPTQATDAALIFLEGNGDSLTLEAPMIFEWEVRNVLLKMGRRGVLEGVRYADTLQAYDQLKVRLHTPAAEVQELAALAREVGLSLFDVAYFALALDRGWALVSRDDALLMTARASGVECFDLRSTTR